MMITVFTCESGRELLLMDSSFKAWGADQAEPGDIVIVVPEEAVTSSTDEDGYIEYNVEKTEFAKLIS